MVNNMYGYQQYKEQTVNTMTGGEMLDLLYGEILKRLTRADMALKSKDYITFEQSVRRANDIVLYLKENLDWNYPISAQLAKFYDFFIYELGRLSASRKPEIIGDIKGLVSELKGAFQEASKRSGL